MGSITRHRLLVHQPHRIVLTIAFQLAAAFLLAAGCAASLADATVVESPPSTRTQPVIQVAAGRDIAVARCSSCHAIDAAVDSPNSEAPPLKHVLWRYSEEGLAAHFIEAVRVGHGDMPVFDFNPVGTDALIAYLKSIKSARDPEAE